MMATFEGNRAIGNLGGGFYTSSPFSKFTDCVAEGNFGPGFVDDSANGSFEKVMTALLGSGMAPAEVSEVHEKTGNAMDALRSGDKAKAKVSYERIMALTADHFAVAQPLLSALGNLF